MLTMTCDVVQVLVGVVPTAGGAIAHFQSQNLAPNDNPKKRIVQFPGRCTVTISRLLEVLAYIEEVMEPYRTDRTSDLRLANKCM